jgi:hypothetical protein
MWTCFAKELLCLLLVEARFILNSLNRLFASRLAAKENRTSEFGYISETARLFDLSGLLGSFAFF